MKKLLCVLLAMAALLSSLSLAAGAAGAQSGSEVPYEVLVDMPIRMGGSDWSGHAFRVGSLVFVTYFMPQTNYRLNVLRADRSEYNALVLTVAGEFLDDVGLTVIGTGLLVLHVPLKDVIGTRGVTFETVGSVVPQKG
jgi:hypothetical protein